MPSTFFTSAPAGLNAEQLAARDDRQRHAENAVAMLLSEGPGPSPESLELMQRFVDGELTLDQVDELTQARLQAKYHQPEQAEGPTA